MQLSQCILRVGSAPNKANSEVFYVKIEQSNAYIEFHVWQSPEYTVGNNHRKTKILMDFL